MSKKIDIPVALLGKDYEAIRNVWRQGYVAAMDEFRARVAELEAANEWHPASEPPPMPTLKEVVVHDMDDKRQRCCGYFEVLGCKWKDEQDNDMDVIYWRDLPPLPEEGS